jgi:spore coat protein U-like protein
VTTNGALSFPAFTPSQGTITTTSTIGVKCTNTTPYNIGLGAGSGTGATVTTRVAMKGSDKLEYQLFSNSGRTANWGETVGTDTVAGTGSGYSTEKTHTVYGKISEQLDAVPGNYSDTVAITVTY